MQMVAVPVIGDVATGQPILAQQNVESYGLLPEMDFDGKGFVMDTRQFREILGGISLAEPEVLTYIRDYVKENMADCRMNF